MRCSKLMLRWIALTLCGGIGGQIAGLVWWSLANHLSSRQFMLITFAIVVPATLWDKLIPALRKLRKPSFLMAVVDALLLGLLMGAASTDEKHLRPAIAGMLFMGIFSGTELLREWTENRFGHRAARRYIISSVCGFSGFAPVALAFGITLERLGVTGWPWMVAFFSSGTLGAIAGAKLGCRLADCLDLLEARHLERMRHRP